MPRASVGLPRRGAGGSASVRALCRGLVERGWVWEALSAVVVVVGVVVKVERECRGGFLFLYSGYPTLERFSMRPDVGPRHCISLGEAEITIYILISIYRHTLSPSAMPSAQWRYTATESGAQTLSSANPRGGRGHRNWSCQPRGIQNKIYNPPRGVRRRGGSS